MSKDLRTAGIALDMLFNVVLFSVYREDYSLAMFLLTKPVSLILALMWLNIRAQAKGK